MPELNFKPDWLSPPGDTIIDILQEQRVSPEDFAERMGHTREYAISLIRGNTIIDQRTAKLLASVLGSSDTFWLNREHNYRAALAQCEASVDPNTRSQWLRTLPLTEMKNLGWLHTVEGGSSEAIQCLRFFGVPTVADWNASVNEMLSAVSLKTSRTFQSDPGAMAAWIRQGELEAASVVCDKWDPKKFRATLQEIRKLTREDDPKVFIPEIRRLCAACGVAVVVLRAPAMCKASGACRVLPGGLRLLMLSARYLSDDHFWFTFFHEAGHLLLHSNRPLHIDVPEDEEHPSSKDEEEANAFAADILVPPAYRDEMLGLPVDGRRVMRFARNIGIAPGIVVGQMQHFGALTHRQLNNLKRRFRWAD